MTSSRARQSKHVTYAMSADIRDYLRPIIDIRDKDQRLVAYKDGHSDETVARHFEITSSQAANQRIEHFGQLWKRTKEQEHTDRITALEARVAKLELTLEPLTEK